MAREWMEQLAEQIKEQCHEAAEEFGRSQHQGEIIDREGRIFFVDLTRYLEDNFTQMRRLLQGDPAAAESAVTSSGATEAHLTRARFPFFDAHLWHRENRIELSYAKDPGVVESPELLERQTLVYGYRVDPEDKLYVEESFGDQPARFADPESLAERITALLFAIEPAGRKPPAPQRS